MTDPTSFDAALVESCRRRIEALASELPEVEVVAVNQHTQLRLRKRTVAYLLVDHHGDGVLGLVVKAAPGDNEDWIERDAERFYLPAYLGVKGWVGIRLDVEPVPWDLVEDLLRQSYRLVAPKSLATRLLD